MNADDKKLHFNSYAQNRSSNQRSHLRPPSNSLTIIKLLFDVRKLFQCVQVNNLQSRLMRALQADRGCFYTVPANSFLPPCRFNTPSLPWPHAHLFQIYATVFRRKIEERLCEFCSDWCLCVTKPWLECICWNRFTSHRIHGARRMLMQRFL